MFIIAWFIISNYPGLKPLGWGAGICMDNKCPFSDILKVEKHWPTESNSSKVCVTAKTMPLGPGSACTSDFICHCSCPAPYSSSNTCCPMSQKWPLPSPALGSCNWPPGPHSSITSSGKPSLSAHIYIFFISQGFSTRGDYALQGTLGKSVDIFNCHDLGWGSTTIIWWVEFRDAAKHPTVQQDTHTPAFTHLKELSSPPKTSIALILRNPATAYCHVSSSRAWNV